MSTFDKKNINILIVDDNSSNIQLLKEIFDYEGYSINSASSGKTALEKIKTIQPDLILLDVKMPDISGFDVCRILKSQNKTKEIPIIFLSATPPQEMRISTKKVGGADYITKPFQVDEIISRVENQLRLKNA